MIRIIHECHNALISEHRSYEKTCFIISRDFCYFRQYNFVHKYVCVCKVYQRLKRSPLLRAQLQLLPVPTNCREFVSINFVLRLPKEVQNNNGIRVYVIRFYTMVCLTKVPESTTKKCYCQVFVNTIFEMIGLSHELASDINKYLRQVYGVSLPNHVKHG